MRDLIHGVAYLATAALVLTRSQVDVTKVFTASVLTTAAIRGDVAFAPLSFPLFFFFFFFFFFPGSVGAPFSHLTPPDAPVTSTRRPSMTSACWSVR